MNSKKTEVRVISQYNQCYKSTFLSMAINSKPRNQFKYLGTLISSDGCNNTEMASRLAGAKKVYRE